MRTHLFRSYFSSWVAWLRRRQRRRPQTMSPRQLQALLSCSESLVVLDVRNPDEFVGERGHITEAVLVPLPELDRRLDELEPHRTRTIVTV